jgi:hypothetical protein
MLLQRRSPSRNTYAYVIHNHHHRRLNTPQAAASHHTMMLQQLRSSAAASARPAGRPAARRCVRVAAAKGGVDNVKDAEAWVARWRAKQGGGGGAAAAAKPAKGGKKAAAAASSPKAGGKLSPCQSFSDGTLLFTAESLKSVKFGDVKL